MDGKNTLVYNFQTFDLLNFIRKQYKPILILTLIGTLTSGIISFTIKPRYKSKVVLFPTPSTSVSKALLSDNVSAKGVATFGEDEEVEQLLQVLHSEHIRNRIIQKYKLMEHYGIDANSKYPRTTLQKKYDENITSDRTEFKSIEIEVLDEDPDTAALIANDIASLIDTTMNAMQKQRATMALKVVEGEYLDLKSQMDKLEDSLVKLRDFGVYDYESQAEVISDAYAQAVSKGTARPENIKLLEDKLKILAKYGGAYISIRDFLEHEKKQLSLIKAKYAEAKVDAEQNLPYKYIVDSAYRAEKKSYPIRWLIVTLSTLATLLFSLLVLVSVDLFKNSISALKPKETNS